MRAAEIERLRIVLDRKWRDMEEKLAAYEAAIKETCENCGFDSRTCAEIDCRFHEFRQWRGPRDEEEGEG